MIILKGVYGENTISKSLQDCLLHSKGMWKKQYIKQNSVILMTLILDFCIFLVNSSNDREGRKKGS